MDATNTIRYSADYLEIKIRTTSPGALHYSLLRGMISSLKLHLLTADPNHEDVDGLVALSDVLSKSLPTERQLVKAYK